MLKCCGSDKGDFTEEEINHYAGLSYKFFDEMPNPKFIAIDDRFLSMFKEECEEFQQKLVDLMKMYRYESDDVMKNMKEKGFIRDPNIALVVNIGNGDCTIVKRTSKDMKKRIYTIIDCGEECMNFFKILISICHPKNNLFNPQTDQVEFFRSNSRRDHIFGIIVLAGMRKYIRDNFLTGIWSDSFPIFIKAASDCLKRKVSRLKPQSDNEEVEHKKEVEHIPPPEDIFEVKMGFHNIFDVEESFEYRASLDASAGHFFYTQKRNLLFLTGTTSLMYCRHIMKFQWEVFQLPNHGSYFSNRDVIDLSSQYKVGCLLVTRASKNITEKQHIITYQKTKEAYLKKRICKSILDMHERDLKEVTFEVIKFNI